MIKFLIILLTTLQTNPYSGTFKSNTQTLNFLENNKCTLTISTEWHGSRVQKFKWRIKNEDTIELIKLGSIKHTFKRVEHNGLTYLVPSKNLTNFTANLSIIENKPTDNSHVREFEKYLIAKETIDATLSK